MRHALCALCTCLNTVCILLQVFASLFTLSKNRKTTDWRWTAARVVLEFLQVSQAQLTGLSLVPPSND